MESASETLFVNSNFVKKVLKEDFFSRPAEYYVSFGLTAKTLKLINEIVPRIQGASEKQKLEYSKPKIFYMRNDETCTKKGIIIELPKPFYDGDSNYVFLYFVGVKFYYLVTSYDFRVHGFSMYSIDIDKNITDYEILISSPQDFWNKVIKLPYFTL